MEIFSCFFADQISTIQVFSLISPNFTFQKARKVTIILLTIKVLIDVATSKLLLIAIYHFPHAVRILQFGLVAGSSAKDMENWKLAPDAALSNDINWDHAK